MYTLLYFKWIIYCIAQGSLLNVMWQPGQKGNLGENGYMYMYGWVLLLFTWNYQNIVNWLYFNIKKKKFFLKRRSIPLRLIKDYPETAGTVVSRCRKRILLWCLHSQQGEERFKSIFFLLWFWIEFSLKE